MHPTPQFVARFKTELAGRLHRFINQMDIAARVPPGLLYLHCGKVKRIVRPGVLERLGATAEPSIFELDESDLPPMTAAEEEALLQALENDPGALAANGAVAEGRIALFGDHAMGEYIRLLTDIRNAGGRKGSAAT